jgi:hypothetical protein
MASPFCEVLDVWIHAVPFTHRPDTIDQHFNRLTERHFGDSRMRLELPVRLLGSVDHLVFLH